MINPVIWRRIAPVIEEPLSEEECDEAHTLPVIHTSRCIKKGISDFRLFLQAHSKDTNNMQELLNTLEEKFDDLTANSQVQQSINNFLNSFYIYPLL